MYAGDPWPPVPQYEPTRVCRRRRGRGRAAVAARAGGRGGQRVVVEQRDEHQRPVRLRDARRLRPAPRLPRLPLPVGRRRRAAELRGHCPGACASPSPALTAQLAQEVLDVNYAKCFLVQAGGRAQTVESRALSLTINTLNSQNSRDPQVVKRYKGLFLSVDDGFNPTSWEKVRCFSQPGHHFGKPHRQKFRDSRARHFN